MKKFIYLLISKFSTHSLIIKNFSYLALIQVINLLVTICSYPYLLRALGRESFGLVVFSQAIVSYFVILVSYGFNISATKEISRNRDDKEKLEEIISSIFTLKGFILIFSFILLILGLTIFHVNRKCFILFILTMSSCFYEFIFASWFFQGTENMKDITIITVTSKLIFVLLIFLFVYSPNDIFLVPIFNGIGSVIAGLYSIYLIFFKCGYKFKIQRYSTLKYYFKEAHVFFISSFFVQFFSNANKVLVGSYLGMSEVAYYDLSEKIVLLFKLPQAILMQTIFPKISNELNKGFIRKMFQLSTLFNFILFLNILLFGNFIIEWVGGTDMKYSIVILKILALTIPINGISNYINLQILTPFGHQNEYRKNIIISLIFYCLLIVFLLVCNILSLINLTYVSVLTELLTMILGIYVIRKYRVISFISNK
jgi:PST family polysaccharide transporter